MIDPRIRLRHLDCFIETARLGSLTAAAEVLEISQPAASKTIRELEKVLGCKLFDRRSRYLSLNPAGQLFQMHVHAGLTELKRGQDGVRQMASDHNFTDPCHSQQDEG